VNVHPAKGESLLASLLKDEIDKMVKNPDFFGSYPSKICDNRFCMKYILFVFFCFFWGDIVNKILRWIVHY
jgi:hypothetical protein